MVKHNKGEVTVEAKTKPTQGPSTLLINCLFVKNGITVRNVLDIIQPYLDRVCESMGVSYYKIPQYNEGINKAVGMLRKDIENGDLKIEGFYFVDDKLVPNSFIEVFSSYCNVVMKGFI